MPTFSTARLGANDLISTFPGQLGNLESLLCTLFGFTADTNITESPLSLSNDGKVTKRLLRQYGTDVAGTSGVGLHITNSTNSHAATFSMESEGVTPSLVLRGDGTKVFSVDAATGNLYGSTTQDATQTPLIPASSGSALDFYNESGAWARPSNSPSFFGGVFIPGAVTVAASASLVATPFWTNPVSPNPAAFPSGTWLPGADTEKIQIPFFSSGQPSRWFVGFDVALSADDPRYALDADVYLYQNGAPILHQKVYHPGGDPPYENVDRIASASTFVTQSGSGYFKMYVTNNSSNTSITVSPAYNTDPSLPEGRVSRVTLIAIG